MVTNLAGRMSGFEPVLSAARACGVVDDDVATAPTVTPARRRQGRKSHPWRRTPSCPARWPASRSVRKTAGRSADDVHKGRHGLMQNLEWRSKGQSAHAPALRQSECRTLESTSLKRASGGDYLGTNLERVREIVSVHLPALAAQMGAVRHETDPPE